MSVDKYNVYTDVQTSIMYMLMCVQRLVRVNYCSKVQVT